METPKFVQLVVAPYDETESYKQGVIPVRKSRLYALDVNGDVWLKYVNGFAKLPREAVSFETGIPTKGEV
jgi:hypothetical protein